MKDKEKSEEEKPVHTVLCFACMVVENGKLAAAIKVEAGESELILPKRVVVVPDPWSKS